jgi:hypothetical protein
MASDSCIVSGPRVAQVLSMSKTWMSRRQVLAAAALASSAVQVYAEPSRMPISPSIRSATRDDLSGVVDLLLQDAQTRAAIDARLWRPAPDAKPRLERAVGRAGELWLLAEDANRIVGVTHAMIVPVPPIYDDSTPGPGLLLDDCFVSADASPGAAEALLVATEAALTAAGAARLIASCPAAGLLRPLYQRHGYEPVTLYMAKHGFRADAMPSSVRPARADDVPAIVRLSARHRRTLAEIAPDFWHIHAQADARFDAWMRRSLTLRDRDMLVAGAPDNLLGYIIAQPCSPLLVPAAHDVAAIGVIDDFYDEGFGNVPAMASDAASGADLLAAAESAFARRGVGSTLVVCPAAWPSKIALHAEAGTLV